MSKFIPYLRFGALKDQGLNPTSNVSSLELWEEVYTSTYFQGCTMQNEDAHSLPGMQFLNKIIDCYFLISLFHKRAYPIQEYSFFNSKIMTRTCRIPQTHIINTSAETEPTVL